MNFQDFEKAFSVSRLSRYLSAMQGNKSMALKLYRLNIKLSSKFYSVLNILEITLRNSINEHYKTQLNDDNWIQTQLQANGFLEHSPHKYDALNRINELVRREMYSHDKVVSSQSFGFWTYMFTRLPFRNGGQTLLNIFPNRDRGLGQRHVFNELSVIKNFRNRIAHHEPICFDSSGNVSIEIADQNYDLIIKYLRFLGFAENEILYGLNINVHKLFDDIRNMVNVSN